MTKDEIIERLRNDEDYYGDFGKKFRRKRPSTGS